MQQKYSFTRTAKDYTTLFDNILGLNHLIWKPHLELAMYGVTHEDRKQIAQCFRITTV